jgi:hypothetical protein
MQKFDFRFAAGAPGLNMSRKLPAPVTLVVSRWDGENV